jgi:hypothetical protein
MKGFAPEKLVFLDETSAKTNLTRLYGLRRRGSGWWTKHRTVIG